MFSTATALGSVAGGATGTIFTIAASEAAGGAITYSSQSAILTQTTAGGMNCTLNTSTGVISSSGTGFDLNDGSATNFSFIIRATDPQNQTTDRTFTCSSSYGIQQEDKCNYASVKKYMLVYTSLFSK